MRGMVPFLSKQSWPHLLVVIGSFIVLSVFLLHHFGVMIVNDSGRYLAYADHLRQGFYIDPHNIWYVGYAYFLLLIRWVSSDIAWVVVVQVAVSLCGVLALRQAVLAAFENQLTATIAALLYLGFFEILTWNSYILTESLYLSATCISLWILTISVYSHGTRFRWYWTVPVVLFTCLLKPTGIALAGAMVVTTCYLVIQRNSLRYPWLLIVAMGILFLLLVNKMLGTFQVIQDYAKGEVIYDITTLPSRPEYKGLHLQPPTDLFIPSQSLPPLIQIIVFIIHNPFFWLKLFFTKLYYFILHIRPYWSWAHDFFVVLYLLPAYAFAIFTLTQSRLPIWIRVFCWTYIGLHALSVCLTSVDWDGRFLMPVLPVIFALAAPRIAVVLEALRFHILHNRS